MLEFLLERANYWAVIVLMMIGLYITFASQNLIKRMVGLGLFQTTICLFYVTLGKVSGGTAPILFGEDAIEGAADPAVYGIADFPQLRERLFAAAAKADL